MSASQLHINETRIAPYIKIFFDKDYPSLSKENWSELDKYITDTQVKRHFVIICYSEHKFLAETLSEDLKALYDFRSWVFQTQKQWQIRVFDFQSYTKTKELYLEVMETIKNNHCYVHYWEFKIDVYNK